jgi:glycosyltransferase involved in cell wall biosynthesis
VENLLAKGLPLHLVVAGVGPAVEDIKSRLGDHAVTPGFIAPAELARLYASTDVLAVPSEVEIHSLVALEAIASGSPTIIAGKSGVAQLFNTPAMWIVESGVPAWVEALGAFATQSDKRQAMRDAALIYRRDCLASWQDVLTTDLLPVWQQAASRLLLAREAA